MRRIFYLAVMLMPLVVGAKQYTVSGTVMAHDNRETLISSYVTDTVTWQKTITNQSGFYSISLPEGIVALRASYVGYSESSATFELTCDTVINFLLSPQETLLGEIVITHDIPVHEQTLMGKTLIPIEKVVRIPSFAGVPDLMKAITVIPGISLGSEGRSDIFVRGGDRGQNLILLDGAKLYNTNHFGGFVSLFNSDIIKQVEVYKSGFPSRFGGRASSVIDITTRDGNREKIAGNFTVGILSSSLAVDGPVGEKLSFNVGVRTTYYDLFTLKSRMEYAGSDNGNYYGYTFYDANAKVTYHISDKHKAFLSFYSGNDYNKSKYKDSYSSASEEDISDYDIYNTCLTIGDRFALNSKTIWLNTLIFSRYKNTLETKTTIITKGITNKNTYDSYTSISEYNLQSRLECYASKQHTLKAGLEYSNYYFMPGNSHTRSEDSGAEYSIDTITGYSAPITANEAAIYAEDDICIGHNFYANIGIRGVLFSNEGVNYLKAEPRISLRAMLNDNISLKTSYSIMNQFNHVVVINYGIYEKETWITSTSDIPPQHAQQVSLGIFATVPSLKTELSVEAYYKDMNDLIEYNPSSSEDLIVFDLDKSIVKDGNGEAYGLEFQAKYNGVKLSIDAGYVLSWNYRQFSEINNGERYPFLYDRRHQLSFLVSYIMGKHYSVNANFSFATGRPYTVPESYVYIADAYGDKYQYYAMSEINNYRMPNYHRLDVALVKREKTKRGREQQFSLNIYNIYARQNPVSIYFNGGKLYQVSLFTIVPTVSYSLKF